MHSEQIKRERVGESHVEKALHIERRFWRENYAHDQTVRHVKQCQSER